MISHLCVRTGYVSILFSTLEKAEIVTSLNDTTLARVTYEKYATRFPDEVVYGIYEWFSSQ